MAGDIGFLTELGIELTNRCNFVCKHCLRDENLPRKNIPFRVVKKILKEAKTYGIKHIGFTGGEPTLHPKFDEILGEVVKGGFTYHCVTNAWNFLEMLPLFEKHGLSSLKGLSFSLDSPREEVHDYLRKKGSYKRIMQAVSVCFMKKIPFNLQMTVCTKNKDQLEEMALLASKLQAEKLFFAFIQPTPGNVEEGLVPTPVEQSRLAREITRLAGIFSIGVFLSPGFDIPELMFQCRALNMTSLTIDFMGNLVFCCQLSGYAGSNSKADIIANLADTSLFDAHRMLIDKIAKFQKDRVSRIEKKNLGDLDRFPCFYCARYFGKVDWLRNYKGNAWNKE